MPPKEKSQEKKAPKTHKFEVNQEKLEQLKKAAQLVRTGGPGSVRRKFKAVRKTSTADDVKIQQVLRKFNLNKIPDVSEVNFIMENGTAMSFEKPGVQAGSGTFVISGKYTEKSASELSSGNILEGLDMQKLTEMYSQMQQQQGGADSDAIPEVESFETVA